MFGEFIWIEDLQILDLYVHTSFPLSLQTYVILIIFLFRTYKTMEERRNIEGKVFI